MSQAQASVSTSADEVEDTLRVSPLMVRDFSHNIYFAVDIGIIVYRRGVIAGGGAILMAGVGYLVYTRNVIELRILNSSWDEIGLGITVSAAEEIIFEDTYELESGASVSEDIRLAGETPYIIEAESYPDAPWGRTRRLEIQRDLPSEIHVEYSIASRLTIADPDRPRSAPLFFPVNDE